MCGIAGIVGDVSDNGVVLSMLEVMKHRGPIPRVSIFPKMFI